MPQFLVPKLNPRHRAACFSLYRALLKQAEHIPLPSHLTNAYKVPPLKHQVRKTFRRNASKSSQSAIQAALQEGTNTETLFHSALTGSNTALEQIIEHITQIQTDAAVARAITALAPKKEYVKKEDRPTWPAPRPASQNIFELRPRPAEELKGRRRNVPTMVNANTLPMIRYKGTQSAFLSRIIRDKVKKKQMINDRTNEVPELLELVRGEDEWDERIERLKKEEGVADDIKVIVDGSEEDISEEPAWADVINKHHDKLHSAYWKMTRNEKIILDKMNLLVREEKRLALIEKKKKIIEKNDAKRKRKGLPPLDRGNLDFSHIPPATARPALSAQWIESGRGEKHLIMSGPLPQQRLRGRRLDSAVEDIGSTMRQNDHDKIAIRRLDLGDASKRAGSSKSSNVNERSTSSSRFDGSFTISRGSQSVRVSRPQKQVGIQANSLGAMNEDPGGFTISRGSQTVRVSRQPQQQQGTRKMPKFTGDKPLNGINSRSMNPKVEHGTITIRRG